MRLTLKQYVKQEQVRSSEKFKIRETQLPSGPKPNEVKEVNIVKCLKLGLC